MELSVSKTPSQTELSMSAPFHKPDCAAQNSDMQLSAGEVRSSPLSRELSRAVDTVKQSRTEVEYQAMVREKELVMQMCDMLRGQLRDKDAGHALAMRQKDEAHALELKLCNKEMDELRDKVQQLERVPKRHATGEPRAKGPGEGRSLGHPKPKKFEVTDIVFQKNHFFLRAGLGREEFRDTLSEMYEKENNLYWPEDKANAKQQANYKANWAIDVLCAPTKKFRRGDVGEMLEYMLGTDDIGEDGEFSCREAQIAHWFYPTADFETDEYVQNQMTKCMTGLNAMNHYYKEYYTTGKDFPPGWQEGMPKPPSPQERREAKKRQREQPRVKKVRGRPKKARRSSSSEEEEE